VDQFELIEMAAPNAIELEIIRKVVKRISDLDLSLEYLAPKKCSKICQGTERESGQHRAYDP